MRFLTIIALSFLTFWAPTALAQNSYDVKVGYNGYNYYPKTVNCQVGDTIRFIWVAGNNPTRSDDAQALPNFTLSASNPIRSFVMSSAGTINYYSSTHSEQGMIGQINVNGLSAALASKSLSTSLSVFPNPAEDKINVNFIVKKESQVVIRLLDVLGNDVAILTNERLNLGDYKLSFNVPSKVTKGLYFVKVSVGSEVGIKRISIQ
jgi:plastocyanin